MWILFTKRLEKEKGCKKEKMIGENEILFESALVQKRVP